MKGRRSIYLLPSLLTTGSLFAGFLAIIFAGDLYFEQAALCIFVAMILDTLDGRVARLTHTASEFGLHYDSLSDMLAFGVAPALVLYEWSLQYLQPIGGAWGKLGWLAAFFYIAAVCLRLARFNINAHVQDRAFFRGLPSPAAAGLLMGLVWVMHELGHHGADHKTMIFSITLILSFLLVSPFSYYSFKETTPKAKVRLITWLAILIGLMLLAVDPPKILLLVFTLYAFSGPALYLVRLPRRINRKAKEEPNEETPPTG